MKRGDDETLSVHEQLATLGVTSQDTHGRRRVDIPVSPWLHASYWVDKKPAGQRLTNVHPLLGAHVEMPSGHEHLWQTDIGVETLPWLADHTIQGRAAVSAAGFAEMALAAAGQALGASRRHSAGDRAAADPGRSDPRHDTAFARPRCESR